MTQKEAQLVRMKFDLSRDQEQVLWNFINSSLRTQSLKLKQSVPPAKQDGRTDLRVTFDKKVEVEFEVKEASRLPAQTIKAQFVDLSMGGCCLGVDPTWQLTAGLQGVLTIKLTSPELHIGATVLEVKSKAN